MPELARYWGTDYGLAALRGEAQRPAAVHHRIDGLDIHFIHVRSQHEDALPLIVTHGWPGSIIEQLRSSSRSRIPRHMGASATDAFHLVLPSLPGHGFSAKPSTLGGIPPASHVPGWS